MMRATAIKYGLLSATVALTILMLNGCGLTQTVADGTMAMGRAVFCKQVKTLYLDFIPRGAINTDEDQTPLATVLRIYQLKDREAFDTADYAALLRHDNIRLRADLLVGKSVTVLPGGTVSLDMPMDKNARYVAVAGFFRAPDLRQNSWRLVLEHDELDPDRPRTIAVGNGALRLLPLKD